MLDPTAKEKNLEFSIRKFFIDTLYYDAGIPVLFDQGLAPPSEPIDGQIPNYWIDINIGDTNMSALSELLIELYVCSTVGYDDFDVIEKSDLVRGKLSDIDNDDSTDGFKRIPIYNTDEDTPLPVVGYMVVNYVAPSRNTMSTGGFKIKKVTVGVKWATRI